MKRDTDRTLFARVLRRRQTEAERLLWARLRSRQVTDAKFRRQHAVGPYVVDFLSPERKLIIEIDGDQHDNGDARASDQRRTAWLNERGYTVMRFWNNEVLTNVDGVLESIVEALK